MSHRPSILRTLLVVCVLSCAGMSTARGDGIAWRASYDAARAESAASGKPLLLHFGATWCGPCKGVEQAVFTNPEAIATLNTHFVPVKVDVDERPELVGQYHVGPIPADLVIAPNGAVVQRESGAKSATVYVASLTRALAYYQQGANQNAQVAAAMPPFPRTPTIGVSHTTLNGQVPASGLYANQSGAVGAVTMNAPLVQSTPPASYPQGAFPQPPQQQPPYQQPAYQQGVPPQQMAVQQVPMTGVPMSDTTSPQVAVTNPSPVATYAPMPNGTAGPPAPPVAAPAGENPPLGLDGYCPVSLVEKSEWTPGRPEYGLRHRGRTYLFAGADEWQRFNNDPDKYAPLAAGLDPVLMVDEQLRVDGRRRHGVTYRGQVLLFASEETLDRFSHNPERYASLVRPTTR
ncbi:MAG: thioredoxin family protein [Pirellulales bacterium]